MSTSHASICTSLIKSDSYVQLETEETKSESYVQLEAEETKSESNAQPETERTKIKIRTKRLLGKTVETGEVPLNLKRDVGREHELPQLASE